MGKQCTFTGQIKKRNRAEPSKQKQLIQSQDKANDDGPLNKSGNSEGVNSNTGINLERSPQKWQSMSLTSADVPLNSSFNISSPRTSHELSLLELPISRNGMEAVDDWQTHFQRYYAERPGDLSNNPRLEPSTSISLAQVGPMQDISEAITPGMHNYSWDAFFSGSPVNNRNPLQTTEWSPERSPHNHSHDASSIGSSEIGVNKWDSFFLRRRLLGRYDTFNLSQMSITRASEGLLPTLEESSADSAFRAELYNILAPSIGERLLSVFWVHLYCYVPIFSKSIYSKYKDNPLQSFRPCQLAAIYILAIEQWSFDEELCVQSYASDTRERLFKFVMDQIHREMSKPTLSTFQACLCILHGCKNIELPFQWSLMSATVSIAQTLCLHLDSTGLDLPPAEVRLRRRCWWAMYAHETMFSLGCGCASHVKSTEFNVPIINEMDFASDRSTQARCAHFIQLVRLTVIMEPINNRLFSLKTVSTDEDLREEILVPLRDKLRKWNKKLPPQLALAEYEVPYHQPNGNPTLHLAYHVAEIALFYHELQHSEHWLKVRSEALEYMKQITSFIADLRPRHCQAFWHCWSRSSLVVVGQFVIHLLATASTIEEAVMVKKVVDGWRYALAIQSRVFDVMSPAMFALDSLYHSGLHNVLNFSPNIKSALREDWLKTRKLDLTSCSNDDPGRFQRHAQTQK